MPRLRLLLTLFLVLVAVPAAAARAAAPEVGMADDRVLLWGGPDADAAVARWHDLGVDVVRIHALWNRIAPDAGARRPPAGFDAADPSAPGYDFAQLDAAVERVRGAGMAVMLTITGPGPLWATDDPSRGDAARDPRPDAYAAFAAAVARRYAGRVATYILWNEPNVSQWLRPQSTCTSRGCTPAAPHRYRALVRAAYPAVEAADPSARVLLGALAPRGTSGTSTMGNLRPLAFLRAFGCVDSRYRAIRTGACKGFHSAQGDGFAYHPHGLKLGPTQATANPDEVNLANLGRLESTLDRLQRAHALRSGDGRRLSLWLDEYGYQTNPPDRYLGVSAATQDKWLQQGAYLAARDPRVRNLTQYVWRDEPVRVAGAGWQSGLIDQGGRPKAALAHFSTPFWLDGARGVLWGQDRPGGAHYVEVQRRLRGSATWTTIATRQTSADGSWSLRTRLARGAAYRFVADGAASAAMTR